MVRLSHVNSITAEICLYISVIQIKIRWLLYSYVYDGVVIYIGYPLNLRTLGLTRDDIYIRLNC